MIIKTEYVSYNQDSEKADAQVDKLVQQGYLVVETYGTDTDCGQILQIPTKDNDVLERHNKHKETCKRQAEFRKKHFGWT